MGRWLVAGTDTGQRYPCLCARDGSCDPAWCPCAGRGDANAMPPRCCAHRYSPADVAIARREYDARKARRRPRNDTG